MRALTLSLLLLAAGPAAAESRHHRFRVETVAAGFDHPWSLAFLPDGRLLVTERGGGLSLVDPRSGERAALSGVPKVYARGQGGLMDVALHPDFAANGLVYLSYAAAGEGGAATRVGRGRLKGAKLEGFETIFTALPFSRGGQHFGSRLVFDGAGRLFISLGERGDRDRAQQLDSYHGSLVRIEDDGGMPKDNPFAGRAGAQPGIWSYGHRNIQGMTLHPDTGVLWLHEHGPRGGDEINLPKPGRNYGWPKATFGREYYGPSIGVKPPAPGLESPLHQWTPSIAPSGMAFYAGAAFPKWRGDLFVGGLVARKLVRLRFADGKAVEEEDLLMDLRLRIRDVRVGPDGFLYVLPDEKGARILRLVPEK